MRRRAEAPLRVESHIVPGQDLGTTSSTRCLDESSARDWATPNDCIRGKFIHCVGRQTSRFTDTLGFAMHNMTGTATDVFAEARWLDGLSNGTARAVDLQTIEWKCHTYGSGDWGGEREDVGIFWALIETFDLSWSEDFDDHQRLVVEVPIEFIPGVRFLVSDGGGLGEDVTSWSLVDEDDYDTLEEYHQAGRMAATAMHNEALVRVGIFDPELVAGGTESIELSERLCWALGLH
jgi:hypothetical protein